MADYKATTAEFQSVANAIRTKGGTQAQLEWPNGFVSAVQAIPTGGGGVSFDPDYSCLYSYYMAKTSSDLANPVSETYTVTETGQYVALNYIVNGEASTKTLENSITTNGTVVSSDEASHSYSSGSSGHRNDAFVIKVINCAVGDIINFSASKPSDAAYVSCCFAVIKIPSITISSISSDVNDIKGDRDNPSGKTYNFNNNSYHLNIALSSERNANNKWISYAHETLQNVDDTYSIGVVSRTINQGYKVEAYDKLTQKIICLNCIVTDPTITSVNVWHENETSYISHGLISYALTVQNS